MLKTPKLYLSDAGLACHLLGISTQAELRRSPFRGAIFEGLAAAEIVKQQTAEGKRREIYHFRDQQALEVDFVVPGRAGAITLVDVKSGSTPRPEMAAPMRKLAAAMIAHGRRASDVAMKLVYEPGRSSVSSRALAPRVDAIPWRALAGELG